MERLTRLHLGAGDKYWPGFINIDAHGDQDSNCPLEELHKEFSGVDEIHAIHLFEHLPRMRIHDFLDSWFASLKGGGLLAMEMPDLDKVCRMHVDGEKNLRMTLFGMFGDPRDGRPGMLHQWCYGAEEIERVLSDAGFTEIKIMEPIFHIAKRDFRVECRRPHA